MDLRLIAVTTVAAAMVITGSAVAGSSTLSTSGPALARSALLRRTDVGRGWSSQPPPRHVPPLTCPQFSPRLHGVVETGAAGSPTFAQSSSGPFVSSVAYVYKTAAQGASVWGRVVTPGLLRCVAQSLVNGSGQGVRFTVDRKHLLTLASIADRRRGYRIIGTATSTYQQIGVYLDEVVLERGRMLAALSFSSFSVAPARSLELRLARTVAQRLQP